MSFSLNMSGALSLSKHSVAMVVSAKQMDSRPRPVHLKAFAPIYHASSFKPTTLAVPPPLTRFVNLQLQQTLFRMLCSFRCFLFVLFEIVCCNILFNLPAKK